MKILNKFLTVLLIALIFVACDSAKKQDDSSTGAEQVQKEPDAKEADLRTVHLEIEGMTCEIGCAKLIQSKLYKADGVSFAVVQFADSSGVVTYDANRMSEKDLVAVVEQAGGGDLYTVSSVDPVPDSDLEEDTLESSD